jgi:FtsZ-binding cell division protein ZapB
MNRLQRTIATLCGVTIPTPVHPDDVLIAKHEDLRIKYNKACDRITVLDGRLESVRDKYSELRDELSESQANERALQALILKHIDEKAVLARTLSDAIDAMRK